MKIFDTDWWTAKIRKHGFRGLFVRAVVKLYRILGFKAEKVMFSIGIYDVDEETLLSASHFDSADALIEHFHTRDDPLFSSYIA